MPVTRISQLLLAALLSAAPGIAAAQAVAPQDHPGFILAEAIAERGCVLHQDDVNDVLAALELEAPAFPQMAVPLMADGFLRPGEEDGTLELTNWGLCTGAAQEVDPAQPTTETTQTETE